MTSFLGYGFIIPWFGWISTSDTKGSYLWCESVTKLPKDPQFWPCSQINCPLLNGVRLSHDEDVLSGVLDFTKFLQEEKVNLYRGGVGYS